jgi:hypothetical protein
LYPKSAVSEQVVKLDAELGIKLLVTTGLLVAPFGRKPIAKSLPGSTSGQPSSVTRRSVAYESRYRGPLHAN